MELGGFVFFLREVGGWIGGFVVENVSVRVRRGSLRFGLSLGLKWGIEIWGLRLGI